MWGAFEKASHAPQNFCVGRERKTRLSTQKDVGHDGLGGMVWAYRYLPNDPKRTGYRPFFERGRVVPPCDRKQAADEGTLVFPFDRVRFAVDWKNVPSPPHIALPQGK